MKRMIVIIMLVCMLVFTGMANTEVAVATTNEPEVITSLYATERATGIDNYGRHFMYLIWKEDLKRVEYTEITDLIYNCDGWNGLRLYGNENGIIGVFWAEDNVPAYYEADENNNRKTDIKEAFTVNEGELKASWVVEGASLGEADKYGALRPVRIVWIKGETNYRLVVVGDEKAPVVVPTPAPTLEPTVKPTATPAPTLEPTAKPTATPAPTLEPTAKPTATPAPTLEPTAKPTATPAPTLEPTAKPTPTPAPTLVPIEEPTPTPAPSLVPIEKPTEAPKPTAIPTVEPIETPAPSLEPIAEPTITSTPKPNPSTTPLPELEKKDVEATARPEISEKEAEATAKPELVQTNEATQLEKKEAETLADETKLDFN